MRAEGNCGAVPNQSKAGNAIAVRFATTAGATNATSTCTCACSDSSATISSAEMRPICSSSSTVGPSDSRKVEEQQWNVLTVVIDHSDGDAEMWLNSERIFVARHCMQHSNQLTVLLRATGLTA